ncbi:hypothetical protein COBT_001221 [Conglomerata obtusa]
MIFALLSFCVHISKIDKGIDITWNSRVGNGINIKEHVNNKIFNIRDAKNDGLEFIYVRYPRYELKIAKNGGTIYYITYYKLHPWVFYTKNYSENNKNDLTVHIIMNQSCAFRIATTFASQNAVAFSEICDVLKVDLHKVMWWHSNKLRVK